MTNQWKDQTKFRSSSVESNNLKKTYIIGLHIFGMKNPWKNKTKFLSSSVESNYKKNPHTLLKIITNEHSVVDLEKIKGVGRIGMESTDHWSNGLGSLNPKCHFIGKWVGVASHPIHTHTHTHTPDEPLTINITHLIDVNISNLVESENLRFRFWEQNNSISVLIHIQGAV